MTKSEGPMESPDLRRNQVVLKKVLDAIERGELDAGSPQAKRLILRLEGALLALEALEKTKKVD